jgi:hypothetical protein
MRSLLLLAGLFFASSVVAAQQRSEWQEFRSDADGFSIEMPERAGEPQGHAHARFFQAAGQLGKCI